MPTKLDLSLTFSVDRYLQTGEKLSESSVKKQEFITKLKAREKEADSKKQALESAIEELQASGEILRDDLATVKDNAAHQQSELVQTRGGLAKLEKTHKNICADLQDSKARNASLQAALEDAYRENAELQRVKSARANQAHEIELAAEKGRCESLTDELECAKRDFVAERHDLSGRLEDARQQIARFEQQLARRDDDHRNELSELQRRVEEGERRNEDSNARISIGTQPLLRQVEQLQAQLQSQSSMWAQVEQRLSLRLRESQSELTEARKRELKAAERVADVEQQLSIQAETVLVLRQSKSDLHTKLQDDAQRAVLLLQEEVTALQASRDEQNREYAAQAAKLKERVQDLTDELAEARSDLTKLQRASSANEASRRRRNDSILADKSATSGRSESSDKTVHDDDAIIGVQSAGPFRTELSRARGPAASGDDDASSQTGSIAQSVASTSNVSHWLFGMPATAPGSVTGSVANAQTVGTPPIFDGFQADSRDGEVRTLRDNVKRLERSRERLLHELTAGDEMKRANDRLTAELADTRARMQNVEREHEVLMQMFGEKTEQVNELTLDLQDVKDAYRAQIDQLTSRLGQE